MAPLRLLKYIQPASDRKCNKKVKKYFKKKRKKFFHSSSSISHKLGFFLNSYQGKFHMKLNQLSYAVAITTYFIKSRGMENEVAPQTHTNTWKKNREKYELQKIWILWSIYLDGTHHLVKY